jgi:hypothetical protein
MFVERIMSMVIGDRFVGLMTPFTWMVLSSYEKLRSRILNENTITNLVRPEYHAFFDSAYVPICSFTMLTKALPAYDGSFIDLSNFYGADIQPLKAREAIKNPDCDWFFSASTLDFMKIPGCPIVYWISDVARECFISCKPLATIADARQGLITGDNERFLRLWTEPPLHNIGFGMLTRIEARESGKRWFPHHKGGGFRKWYGNHEYVVNWENDGDEIRNFVDSDGKLRSRPQNLDYYFKHAITWTALTVTSFNARISRNGFVYDAKGPILCPINYEHLLILAALLNCSVSNYLLKLLAPTMDYNQGPVSRLPWPEEIEHFSESIDRIVSYLEKLAKTDWDSYEFSWNFTAHPLLQSDYHGSSMRDTYATLRDHWHKMTLEMQRFEEENNRTFIEIYGLQEDLTPEVPLSEITLTCNPHHRYGGNKGTEEQEILLLADTVKELISYAIGCMMGRYSLDQPGLIYAHSGNIDFDPSKYQTFPANPDGIIPITDMEWFSDDTANRIAQFMKIVWPVGTLDENLKFLAASLSLKAAEMPRDTIRRYLNNGFYKDHLQTYKRRPIYWLFSSGRERAFQCLVYLHRYNEGTLSRMRNEYVTPLFGKMNARIDFLKHDIDNASSTSIGNKLRKQQDILKRKLAELTAFDDELRHFADKRIKLDLDDGVKVNYGKFGNLLAEVKSVTGE